MFSKLSFSQKLALIAAMYLLITIIEYYLHTASLKYENPYLSIAFTFAESWILMLYGFIFFQTFKSVRFRPSCYKRKSYETKRLYDRTGLNLFQYILTNSFFKYLNRRVYLQGKGREYIRVYHEETKVSETSHYFSLIPTTIIQFNYLFHGYYSAFIWLFIWSLLFNVYPILLQRRNRFLLEDKVPSLLK